MYHGKRQHWYHIIRVSGMSTTDCLRVSVAYCFVPGHGKHNVSLNALVMFCKICLLTLIFSPSRS